MTSSRSPRIRAPGWILRRVRQLVFALEKAVMRKRGGSEPKTEAVRNVICVLGLKGGSGKTLTATNLGVSLAMAGRSVALMDLDLQFGDLALAMGITPVGRSTISFDRVARSMRASSTTSSSTTRQGRERCSRRSGQTRRRSSPCPFLAEVERLLSEMFEFVVIDTPPAFTPEVISAIDSSTDVLVVAMRDTLSLKNTKLGLETLERMEYDRRRMKVLLNRANTNVGIEREDVLAILGRDIDVLVPSNRDITRSINQGVPIALQTGSEASKAFRYLAQLYTDAADGTAARAPAAAEPEAAEQPRKSIFRRAQRV